MDTDSLVIDQLMPSEFCSETELGKFKKEYEIEQGYFLSQKVYCLLTNNGEFLTRVKGLPIEEQKLLKLSDFSERITNLNTSSSIFKFPIDTLEKNTQEIQDSPDSLHCSLAVDAATLAECQAT